jgi:geranylgeranyl pyrophosphate synthase
MTESTKVTPQAGNNPLADVLEFDAAFTAVGETLRRHLRSAPPLVRPLTSHLSKAAGKMIRARALLLCAMDKDGRVNPDAVKVAAAVELLHLATLVHDDIIDQAVKRRGIDALHQVFGEKSAVLCGDYLLCMALDMASEIRVLENRRDSVDRTLPHYFTEICLGELQQDQNEGNYKLSEKAYYKIIKGKTAALFEASFYAGFMFSDEADDAKDVYKDIGNTVGMIFQLADDCADYEFSEARAKKPVLADFSRGVITLPLIHALKKNPALLGRIKDGISPPELKKAVEEAGGLAYTHSKIRALAALASSLTEKLDATQDKKTRLLQLIGKATGQ